MTNRCRRTKNQYAPEFLNLTTSALDWEDPVVVCSCNVFSDHEVRSAVKAIAHRPRMSQLYACLGCRAQCGRCARTIKRIIDETPTNAIGAGQLAANLCAGL
jgi:bacterioferritin-associated ferredoxin